MVTMVKKANGSRVPFDRSKVYRSCRRFHASEELAEEVANVIAQQVTDDTSTDQILEWINQELTKRNPKFGRRVDLRRALSLIPPIPAFETFIRRLLELEGFRVLGNEIVKGRCGEHEVDGIIEKNGGLRFLEVKHHYDPHDLTGLDVPRIVFAILDDLQLAYKEKLEPRYFSGALIVSNNRLSPQAFSYAKCIKIDYIGWDTPAGRTLEDIIESHRFFPITMLRNLRKNHKWLLINQGILTLRDLLDGDIADIQAKTRISWKILHEYHSEASAISS